jgi:hypothetical protein
MEEIRAILVKARIERRNGRRIIAKAYFIKNTDISLNDSTLFTDDEDITLKPPPRKSFTTEWIADTGALAYITDQLYLFRGPLKKVVRESIRVGGDVRLSIKGIESA